MNELKLEDFVGEKHEWIVASHKNKRLYANKKLRPIRVKVQIDEHDEEEFHRYISSYLCTRFRKETLVSIIKDIASIFNASCTITA